MSRFVKPTVADYWDMIEQGRSNRSRRNRRDQSNQSNQNHDRRQGDGNQRTQDSSVSSQLETVGSLETVRTASAQSGLGRGAGDNSGGGEVGAHVEGAKGKRSLLHRWHRRTTSLSNDGGGGTRLRTIRSIDTGPGLSFAARSGTGPHASTASTTDPGTAAPSTGPGPGSGPGAAPSLSRSSDGREVVAVFAGAGMSTMPPSSSAQHGINKALRFRFLGTGADGSMGDRWAIMAVATALAIWNRDRRISATNSSDYDGPTILLG
ncbi:hypothetical protein F5Y17DRAFT_421345 [Xylariaceae sp. FL0594]|nr:hypothetical protein F5Y17DRAFT_421345 [Xylariaceae sp. FL0594]